MADKSDGEYVICPYCGEKYGDCWEWVTDSDKTRECDECGKEFRYWAEYSVTYYSKKVE